MEAKELTSPAVRLDVLNAEGKVSHSVEYVKDKVVLGRILSADLRVDDPRVSRIHALIEVRGGDIVLTDLASTHGTFVNGKKIVEEKIKFGDKIRLGVVDVVVERGSGKPSAPGSSQEGQTVFEGEETQVNIDRKLLDELDRRAVTDRRKHTVIPEEQRLEERRQGDRRIDQREGDRRKPGVGGGMLPQGVEAERRSHEERRHRIAHERRVSERRVVDRRVLDITNFERRIEERRARRGDDDLLPEELEKAFTAPEHARELEVTVLWGDHILDVTNYHDPIVITAGESPRSTYIIPSEGIPDEFPLLTISEDGIAHLAFTTGMKGTVRARDKIYSIQELKDEKFVKKMGEFFVLPLKQDDFAKLAVGRINFFVIYVKPAPRIKPAPIFERDIFLMRTVIGSALFLLLFLVTLSFIPKPKPVTIEMIPERYAKIVIRKKPSIPTAAIVAPREESKQGGSREGEGGPAIGPEGRAGKPNLPEKKEPPQAVLPKSKPKESSHPAPVSAAKKPPDRQRKLVDANKAKKVGLLEAFQKSGVQKELRNLIDAGTGPEGPGGFDDFGKAVKGARGKSIEDSGGAGGMGLKGVDVGGGGTTVGIDGPSTKGLGRGYRGDGIGEGISGPGRFGMKGEHAIDIVSENVQILSGLPKDVINAVVQRHRSQIRACYDAALRSNPNLRGKITIAFTIQPDGIVSASSVKESTVGHASLEQCIISRVKSWKFPSPEAPVVTEVTAYPFFLNPSN